MTTLNEPSCYQVYGLEIQVSNTFIYVDIHCIDMQDKKYVIWCFIFMVGFLSFIVYNYYTLDSAIDYSILHNKIMTNQTFVDEMTCAKVITTKNTLILLRSLSQQNEVEQLKIDFDRLYKEKGCT